MNTVIFSVYDGGYRSSALLDKMRCKCPRGFFGYETTADGKVRETD